MATRVNTVTFPVRSSATTLTAGTYTTMGTASLYIPENSVSNPVTFDSVQLYFTMQDITSGATTTFQELRVSASLSGVIDSGTFVDTEDITYSGENFGAVFGPIDFTSYFNTAYGTDIARDLTISVFHANNFSIGFQDMNGAYGWVELTYRYNDTEPHRLKTICYSLESGDGNLTTTANTSFGWIPALSGSTNALLGGYGPISIRDMWAEFKGNSSDPNTTAFGLTASFDGQSSTNDILFRRIATSASPTYYYAFANAIGLDTTNSHSIDVWSSQANRFPSLITNVYITFDYTASNVTRALNYIELPVTFESTLPIIAGGTSPDYRDREKVEFIIPESNPVLQNIAFEGHYSSYESSRFVFKGINQSGVRLYKHTASLAVSAYNFQHRFDATSSLGQDITLVRGKNTVYLDAWVSSSTTAAIMGLSGVMKVLYDSDVPVSGIDTTNKTIYSRGANFDIITTGATAFDRRFTASIYIPESTYYIQGFGSRMDGITQATPYHDFTIGMYASSSDEGQYGWKWSKHLSISNDNELAYYPMIHDMTGIVKRFSHNQSNLLNVNYNRSYRIVSTTALVRGGTKFITTYHSQPYYLTGSIGGSNGGTVIVRAFESGSNELIATASLSGNGTFYIPVYNPAATIYLIADEGNTRYGRSATGSISNLFGINLNPTPAGGSILIS